MELQFNIRPGIDPVDRHELEDAIVEALGSDADCTGGGGMIDGSESDFTVEVSGMTIEEAVQCCRSVFAAIAFTEPTLIELTVEGTTYTMPTAIEVD